MSTMTSNYRYFDALMAYAAPSLSTVSSALQVGITSPLSSYYTAASVINSTGNYVAFLFHRTSNTNGERPFVVFYIGAEERTVDAIGYNVGEGNMHQYRGLGFGVLTDAWSSAVQTDILSSSYTLSQFRSALLNHGFIGTSVYNGGFVASGTRGLALSSTGSFKYRLTNIGREDRYCSGNLTPCSSTTKTLGIATVATENGMAIYLHICIMSGTRADAQRYGARFVFVNQADSTSKSAFAVKHQDFDNGQRLDDFETVLNNQLFTYIHDGTTECTSPKSQNQSNLCCLHYASSIWDNIPYEKTLPDAENGSALSIPLYMIYNGATNLKRVRVDSDLFKLSIARYGDLTESLTAFKLGKTAVQYLNADSSWRWQGGIVVST